MTIRSRTGFWAAFVIMLLTMATLFSDAKVSPNKIEKRRPDDTKKKDYVVKQIPEKAEKIIVEGNPYFMHEGIYYRKDKTGYRIVKPPHGTQVKRLPNGARVIRRPDNIYYFYFNTYYRYDPRMDIYIVINNPEWADLDYYSDRLSMINGSVLIGRYAGGDRDYVHFIFNGELKRIRVEEIISLEFAPAIYEGDSY
jgi:hypothetical protein